MSRRLFHGQLADEIAGEDRLRAERLRLLARSLVDILRDALVRDGMVRIHGFGTFRLKRMAPRRGINPQTGEPIEIPARNRVLFRPAKALRDRIEPEHPAAVPLAEPHESREAWLGGRMADSPVAGGLPPGDHERSHRTYFPDRVAAASMVAPTARVTASAYPDASRDSASREASLGGAMADSPSAGRVVTADNADSGSGSGSGAANDDTAPIEPGPESVPDQPVPPPAGTVRYGPQVERDRAEADDDEVFGTSETGRSREADLPTLTEPAETTAAATASGSDAGVAPAAEPERDERGSAGRWLALVALLLLAVLLAWWLWPRTEPTPLVSGTPGVTTERTGDTAAQQDEPAAGSATGSGADEPAASAAATGDTADTSGQEPAAASSVADATGDDGEAAETGAAQADASQTGASPAGEEGEADTQSAQAEPEPAGADQAEPAPVEQEPAASDEIETAAATGSAAGEAEAASEAGADAQPEVGAESGTDEAVAQAETSAADTAATETAPTDTATPWFSARKYSVSAGDTLWGLSDRNYVNPYYWPHIWNHNQSLANPDRIEIDQELWLPQLVGEPRSLTAADRRSIAEGYLRLYRFWKDTGAANPQYALVGVRYFDASVMPPELRNDPSAGRPGDAMAAAFEALLMAEFPAPQ